ncbi:leucine-rich repeat transmembrane neuronal protein 1-like [Anopheles maculipalpis]|uniref:leucine-rich repeat transmembrane neuronal protein 1-like n=1 Tax=Anopheles maculipalpis TaxID=1496333 RepID=UPI00215905D2|nr:leucine-rich repeat transmembrane neuronal protein 1-like [Anopheles maculipalpis]
MILQRNGFRLLNGMEFGTVLNDMEKANAVTHQFRLLLLLFNAPRVSAVRMRCVGYSCTITDVRTVEELFVMHYIPAKIRFTTMENVQIKHLHTSCIDQVQSKFRSIHIHKSNTLSVLTVSAAASWLSLTFRYTGLKDIIFEKHCKLETLTVAYSRLVTIPATIYRGTALTSIEMTHSAIQTVEMALFCNLSRLKKLNLSANKVRTVVNSGSRTCTVYDSLEEWNMSQNLLKTISMTLFRPYRMLRVLHLKKNLIRLFAGSFASDMLQSLDISDNKLKVFSLCQWRIPFLTALSLNDNQLSKLPFCLDNLKTLAKLEMDDNQLEDIDFIDMAWMDNLENLNLSGNKLRSLTLNSSDFPMKLKKLCIDGNNITKLQLLVVPGVALAVNAQNNQITDFDKNATSPKISELEMKGNPMDCSWKNLESRMNSECYRDT